ncbi:uncharacterized protein LOC110935422 [Helianthus annuus]|uniref:uncharacterized protein LOC110935422 n=1 Tax=Helianthus annuus TaxID=4232 RepID=UPI000B90A1E8|nr:uncharacterized protein LOC110935422 [Helianthus annuus]
MNLNTNSFFQLLKDSNPNENPNPYQNFLYPQFQGYPNTQFPNPTFSQFSNTGFTHYSNPGFTQYPNLGFTQHPNLGFTQYPNRGFTQFLNNGFSQPLTNLPQSPAISTTKTSTVEPLTCSVDESPSPQLKATKKKRGKAVESSEPQKRQLWSTEEEVILTKGWLHISSDEITGNSQKKNDFWKRVHAYFTKGTSVKRTVDNVRTYWHMIRSKVTSFNNIYNQLLGQKISGCSDDVLLNRAREMY